MICEICGKELKIESYNTEIAVKKMNKFKNILESLK